MHKPSGGEVIHLPNKPGAYVDMQVTQRSRHFRGPAKVLMEKRLFAKNPEELKKLMDSEREITERQNAKSKGNETFVHFEAIHALDKATGEYKKIDAISAGVRNLIVKTGRVFNGLTEGHWPSR